MSIPKVIVEQNDVGRSSLSLPHLPFVLTYINKHFIITILKNKILLSEKILKKL